MLTNESNKLVWSLTTSREFSIKSYYVDFPNGYMVFLRKYIWKLKVPLKIKILMWFLHKKVPLTKDNLAKHN
jgi:hypothetical protein